MRVKSFKLFKLERDLGLNIPAYFDKGLNLLYLVSLELKQNPVHPLYPRTSRSQKFALVQLNCTSEL